MPAEPPNSSVSRRSAPRRRSGGNAPRACGRVCVRGMQLAPPPKGPLDPVIHSEREGDGYRVANVAFESLPGFFVTGNLYRPAAAPCARRRACRNAVSARALPRRQVPPRHAAPLRRAGAHGSGGVRLRHGGLGRVAPGGPRPRPVRAHAAVLEQHAMHRLPAVPGRGGPRPRRHHRRLRRRHPDLPAGGARRTGARIDPRRDGIGPLSRRLQLRERPADSPRTRPRDQQRRHRRPGRAASPAPDLRHLARLPAPGAGRISPATPRRSSSPTSGACTACSARRTTSPTCTSPARVTTTASTSGSSAYSFCARHLDLELAAIQDRSGQVDESFVRLLDEPDLRVWNAAHPPPAAPLSGAALLDLSPPA